MDYSKLQNGSDIRGIALEGIEGQHVNLDEAASRAIGRGFALWLMETLGKKDLRVAVGRDSRLSGPQLEDWIVSAMAEEAPVQVRQRKVPEPRSFLQNGRRPPVQVPSVRRRG